MMTEWDNVILLSADALRADHLSCYGYHRNTSPVLDELAEESIQFTRAYSASSHTREAVPALLTGKYPDVAIDSSYRLATDTIASTLSEEGFATGGFHSNPYVSRAYGFDRGFDMFDDDLHLGQNKFIALAQRAFDKLRNRHYARAEEINERSISWIDSLDGEPFFLWNHYMDTHGPYEPPGEYATLYTDEGLSGRDAQSLYQRAIKKPGSITDDERELLIDLYDGEIRYNDAKIGTFLDALRDRGLLERSLLVVTSDHGDAFGEHGYYEHPRYLHKELVHVPLLVRPPGGSEAEEVSTPVSTLDIAATIADGIGAGKRYEGRSLFNLEPDADHSVFMQASGSKNEGHIQRHSLRTRNGACFCEQDIRIESIEFTECTEQSLKDELEEFVMGRNFSNEENEDSSTDEVDEEIERRLNALGYKE